jgi:tetratricopeptide (TPR) repeat protein
VTRRRVAARRRDPVADCRGVGDPGSIDETPVGSDGAVTQGGVAPIADASVGPDDPIERAALQRVIASLVPRDYQPVRLGRFVLLEELGKGGMGVVHAGYDDTLERRVALKLIGPGRATSEAARRRLFREAQAMAKLSHANVVQVFDAGEQDGHVFIAMELVEGRTLRAWLAETPRPWSEVVAMFLQIGEGLAAAHAGGVVHRDFKPDNVLIGDGPPKVADFGLATLELAAGDSTAGAVLSGSNPSLPPALLTATGEVLGTPAYMAPEQYVDRVSDAASDQFSYCVALYEALWDERPFAGDTLAQIMANVVAGEVRPAPPRSDVPAWVRQIVLRGLAARRRDRFDSMRALLTALADDPRRRRRRAWTRAAAVTTVLGSIAAAIVVVQSRPQPCRDAGSPIADVWGEAPRARVVEGLGATALGYAADTATRVTDLLDRYAEEWAAAALDACEATRIRGVQSEPAMELRLACLDRARAGLTATIEQLVTADATVVERAMALVGALPRIDACADLDALRADVAPPDDPAVAAEVEALRGELAAAVVLLVAGRTDAARAALDSLATRAAAVPYRPLRSAIDEVTGALLVSQSQYAPAEVHLRRALGGALADRDDVVATRAAASLVMLLGARETRFAEAQWLGDVALALAERRGDPGQLGDVYNSLGGLHLQQARYDDAEADFRRAIELLQEEFGEEHPEVAVVHENLGTTLRNQGRDAEGLAEHRRALELRERAFGPEHPLIAIAHAHLGATLQELQRWDEAEAELRLALDLLLRAFGPEHPDVAMGHVNLGIALDDLGRHGDAQTQYRRALTIVERAFGPDHPEVAMAYNNLGTSFEDEGRLVEAEAEFRRSLAISRKAFGEDHPDVARTHGNLASVLVAQGRFAEAVDEAEATIAISKAVLRADHPDLLYAYRGACEAHFAQARDLATRDPVAAGRAATLATERCRAAGPEALDLAERVRQWQADTMR